MLNISQGLLFTWLVNVNLLFSLVHANNHICDPKSMIYKTRNFKFAASYTFVPWIFSSSSRLRHRAGWCRKNALDLCTELCWFETKAWIDGLNQNSRAPSCHPKFFEICDFRAELFLYTHRLIVTEYSPIFEPSWDAGREWL